MRSINKTNAPHWFLKKANTNHKNNWRSINGDSKRQLKKHILEKEQGWICCYCEGQIDQEKAFLKDNNATAHLEHIKPKKKFPGCTYCYDNLVVSCQGIYSDKSIVKGSQFCGHYKAGNYDNTKFLNPVQEKNISSYFVFDTGGKISSSGKDDSKANYTIELLNLNGYRGTALALARRNVLDALVQAAAETNPTYQSLHQVLSSHEEYPTFLNNIFSQHWGAP